MLSLLAEVCWLSVCEGKDAGRFYSSYDITPVSAPPNSARHPEVMPFPWGDECGGECNVADSLGD